MINNVYFYELNFLKERKIYLEENGDEVSVPIEEFSLLLGEYEKLLNQTVHITNISDKMSLGLNTYKQELLEKVNVDELTATFNRRYLFTVFEKYYKDAIRSALSLAVILVDIDFFKNYNDYYGHLTGDVCLKQVAAALMKSIERPSDFVSRYGGEEFYVILPATDKRGAVKVAERIQQYVLDLKIPHQKSKVHTFLTVSIGIAVDFPSVTIPMDNFLQAADEAMYISKDTGRNKITVAEVSAS